MNTGKAILAGAVGGVAMTALAWVVRLFGLPMNAEMMLEMMPAPGAFMAAMGTTFLLLFLAEQFLYAAIVGAMYGPVRHPRERTFSPSSSSTERVR